MKNFDRLIALATFCGWTEIIMEVWDCELGEEPIGYPPVWTLSSPRQRVPIRDYGNTDYANSIDSMYEVEKRFTGDQWTAYIKHLVAPQEGMTVYELIREALQRKASERAVAALKTLNKI
jgi:hypothetical protein